MAGYLTLINQQHPFLLIRRDDDDDPTVVYFLDQPTDPMKATQSLRLTLIPGKDQEHDLLFIRNMTNNQIVAYKRSGPN